MEIDFLGLNSTTKLNNMEERNSIDAIFPTDIGVETSLSLSTTTRPSLYYHREIISEKKGVEFYSSSGSSTFTVCSLTGPPPVFHPFATNTTAGFPYNLNEKLTELRKMTKIPVVPASLTMLSSAGCANAINAENSMYIAANNGPHWISDHTTTTTGYTPTVAMARRATLARFLEQRLHRYIESSKDSPSHGKVIEGQQGKQLHA
ncbi:hypothetical protein CASFOL_042580 [Castilleja foliolosa]|uniref:Uncharacterized protein n=1 Tax=Castilleja foliolosa TaxID=1961234 RepID=A0ABD3B8Y6_9LAMI